MARWTLTLEQRFMQYVSPEPNTGCWLWTGTLNDHGYGRIGVFVNGKHRMVYAHRFAWEMENGPIPPGLCCLHRCDVPSCCNHSHMFLGTKQDNQIDMAKKWRGRRHRRTGLPFGVTFDERAIAWKNPYHANVTVRGEKLYLGCFSTPEEAGRVAADFKANHYQLNPAPPIAAPPLGVTRATARASMLALPIRQE